MTRQTFLEDRDFAHIVRYAPLVSIDIVIRDPRGRVLLGLRANEPAKGALFVPGGIIRKNETIEAAFYRILAAETGCTATFGDARFLGAFEHFYETNRFDDPAYGTHYVVLGYSLDLPEYPSVVPDSQHKEFRWMTAGEVLDSPIVHPNTKAYFLVEPSMAVSGVAK